MRDGRLQRGGRITTKNARTVVWDIGHRASSAQAASFSRTEVGQEASNAGPLPDAPIPAQTGDGTEVEFRILNRAE